MPRKQQGEVGTANPLLAQVPCFGRAVQGRTNKKLALAERLTPTLRRYWKSGESSGCPEEPRFYELYDVLGNREAQDEIRAAHPKEPHCEKLLQSPWACDGCPNNPFKEGEEACSQEELEEMTPFLKLGLELYISHGARPNPWALKTDLWTLASIVGRFFEAQTNSPILGGSPPKSESDA